jgi:hypothetical protein
MGQQPEEQDLPEPDDGFDSDLTEPTFDELEEDDDHLSPGEGETDFVDASSGLIDELERILHSDFAEADEEPSPFDHVAEAGFPLAEPEPTPPAEPELATERDDEDATYDQFEAEPETEPAPPPSPARFWHADELDLRTAPPLAADREPPPRPRSYLTISVVLLLIAAGGAYAYVQFARDPVVTIDGTTVASTGAFAATPPEAAVAEATSGSADPAGVSTPLAALATEGEDAAANNEPTSLVANRAEASGAAGVEPPAFAVTTITPAGEPVGATETSGAPAADPPAAEAAAPTTEEAAGAAVGGPLVAVTDPPATEPPAAAAPTEAVVADAAPPPEPTTTAGVTTTATATTWVNMHTGPDNTTPVTLVVPQGATLEVVACDPWCEVYYEGTHGFIWQDFVTPLP